MRRGALILIGGLWLSGCSADGGKLPFQPEPEVRSFREPLYGEIHPADERTIRVLQQDLGLPIAGAHVFCELPGRPPTEALTDSTGWAALSGECATAQAADVHTFHPDYFEVSWLGAPLGRYTMGMLRREGRPPRTPFEVTVSAHVSLPEPAEREYFLGLHDISIINGVRAHPFSSQMTELDVDFTVIARKEVALVAYGAYRGPLGEVVVDPSWSNVFSWGVAFPGEIERTDHGAKIAFAMVPVRQETLLLDIPSDARPPYDGWSWTGELGLEVDGTRFDGPVLSLAAGDQNVRLPTPLIEGSVTGARKQVLVHGASGDSLAGAMTAAEEIDGSTYRARPPIPLRDVERVGSRTYRLAPPDPRTNFAILSIHGPEFFWRVSIFDGREEVIFPPAPGQPIDLAELVEFGMMVQSEELAPAPSAAWTEDDARTSLARTVSFTRSGAD